jgi:hypothetical protein
MDEFWLAIRTQLCSEPADMRFDNFRFGVEMKIPDSLQQHRPRHHATSVAHEKLEQLKLSRL